LGASVVFWGARRVADTPLQLNLLTLNSSLLTFTF
jgi:hypothetical protein